MSLPAGESDWLHERKWRIPAPSGWVPFTRAAIVAVIVADPEWLPVDYGYIDDYGNFIEQPKLAVLADAVPRWYWNGSALVTLSPMTG